MSRERLVLFPGLGADWRLLKRQQAMAAEVEVPKWIEPHEKESLSAYAKRLAERIDARGRFFLGGVSLGGMLAVEMAKWLRPAGVFVISSCRRAASLPELYRTLVQGTQWVPPTFLQVGALHPPFLELMFGPLNEEAEATLLEMVSDSKPEFIHWGLGAIFGWEGKGKIDVPVFQIHGGMDRCLPVCWEDADEVIEDGGHMINITHAREVNGFIERGMRGV
jgi:pimeloyl-ACP methyl ester carboxylesterase